MQHRGGTSARSVLCQRLADALEPCVSNVQGAFVEFITRDARCALVETGFVTRDGRCSSVTPSVASFEVVRHVTRLVKPIVVDALEPRRPALRQRI